MKTRARFNAILFVGTLLPLKPTASPLWVTPENGVPSDVNDEIIPRIFAVDQVPGAPPARFVPDPVEASWLVLNTVKALAFVPYRDQTPAVSRKSRGFPGVGVGIRPESGDQMQARYQMWALTRCLEMLGPSMRTRSYNQRCRFGLSFHREPAPGERRYDVLLGRLAIAVPEPPGNTFDTTKILEGGAKNDEIDLPSNASIASSPAEFQPALAAIKYEEPVFNNKTEVDLGRPDSYTASIDGIIFREEIDPTLLTSGFNGAIVALAADTSPRTQKLDRTKNTFAVNADGTVGLHFQPYDRNDFPSYEAYLEGLVSVVWKLRSANSWTSCNFAIWRVEDRKRIIDGSIKKVVVPPKGVAATA